MNTPVDLAERERALDPSVSCIVQAPAGSGKTGLLIQRYLALLAFVDHPEEIVAITFTRKAAGEMRQRVIDALQDAADRGAACMEGGSEHDQRTRTLACVALARDRSLGWNITTQPARLRIQTIDSLCLSLTRQMPWTSRYGGGAGLVADASEHFREVARGVFSYLNEPDDEWAADIARLLAHLDNDMPKLERMLVDMLARRDQWLRHLGSGGFDKDGWRAHMQAGLEHAVNDALVHVHDSLPRALAEEVVALGAFAGANLVEAGSDSAVARCAGLTGIPRALCDDLAVWKGLAELLLTEKGEWRASRTKLNGFPAEKTEPFVTMKHRAKQLSAALGDHERFRAQLHSVRRLPAPVYTDAAWVVLESLLRVLHLAAALLRVVFNERGEVDFCEVLSAAQRALGDEDRPTDLALALDYRIRHLLLDEFQDTSHSQLELLRRLIAGWEPGDGRSLFLVGDPMQSIYRFREADVGLFVEAWHGGVGQLALETIGLETNFRSRPELIAQINDWCARIFPDDDDSTSGRVAYAASTSARAGGAGQAVFVHPFVGDDGSAEAVRVRDIVRDSLSAFPGQSIGVLVRARSGLARIIPALRDAGIAYRGVDIEALGDVPVVEDLLSVTRVVLHPADRIAWLAVLRAPWCGMSLADLHTLVADDQDRSVLDLLRDARRVGRLSEPGKQQVARCLNVLEAAYAARGRGGIRRLVEGTWIGLGGPACVSASELSDAESFFCLLDMADRRGDWPSLEWLTAEVAKLYAAPDTGAEGIELMTVHNAKGLEFDTVIVPALDRVTPHDDRRLLEWTQRVDAESGSELLLAPISAVGEGDDPIHQYLRSLERDKDLHEDARLLYVAMTRARERVHLLGNVRIAANGELARPASRSLLGRLWPVLSEHFPVEGDDRTDAHVTRPDDATALRRLVPGWVAPVPAQSIVNPGPPAGETEAQPEQTLEFDWARLAARHIGTLVHRMLCLVSSHGVDAWSGARLHGRRDVWCASLRALGAPESELDAAVDRVETALRAVFDDPRGRWLLDPAHKDARSEYALSGIVDGRLVSVILDRTFVDADGTRWIVDYKTGRHLGGDLDAFLDREQTRYSDQLERYACLMARLDTAPIRLGLYFPLHTGWREWG